MRAFAVCLPLVLAACSDSAFTFRGDPSAARTAAVVTSADVLDGRARIAAEPDSGADEMSFEWRVIDADRAALPLVGAAIVVEGSESEFTELPEMSYWRARTDDGAFVLEGGLAIDNGDGTFTGEDIGAMFSVVDTLWGARVLIANDGARVEVGAGGDALVSRDGVRVRAVVVEAGADALRAYAYAIE